jgi:hypothetical protein
MEEIALVLSPVSVVIAVVALVLNFREGSRRDEEIRFLRGEAGRREEELSLLRQQLDDERRERLQQQRAELIPTRGDTRSDKHRVEYDVVVTNAGPYPAMRVVAETADSEGGSSQRGGVAATLMPGQAEIVTFVGHRLPDVAGDELATALLFDHEVVLEWWDGVGHHREPTGVYLRL